MKAILLFLMTLIGPLLVGRVTCPSQRLGERGPRHNTFAIIAYDPQAKEWGAAVASKVVAVGAGTIWAKAGVGVVATMSSTNVTYGPRGLEMLAQGENPAGVVRRLTHADEDREDRQLGVLDHGGVSAHFTGKTCDDWAGAKAGKHHLCLGNLLANAKVVQAMSTRFEQSQGPLAQRLLAALAAGEEAGGDKRGKQSAALLVVRAKGGPLGLSDRAIDLRVDDHARPIQELSRILALQLAEE